MNFPSPRMNRWNSPKTWRKLGSDEFTFLFFSRCIFQVAGFSFPGCTCFESDKGSKNQGDTLIFMCKIW